MSVPIHIYVYTYAFSRVDQSDEELVESILQLVNLPQASVRTALRLPMRTRGKSIVLVEMDTPEHQEEVIEHKEDLRLFRNALLKIGIRRARYKELWRYVKQLMTVRSTSEEPDLSLLQETTDEDAEVRGAKLIKSCIYHDYYPSKTLDQLS